MWLLQNCMEKWKKNKFENKIQKCFDFSLFCEFAEKVHFIKIYPIW